MATNNISAAATAIRYGVTTLSIESWEKNDNIDFPAPIVMCGRKYWTEQSLDDFDNRCARRVARALRAAGIDDTVTDPVKFVTDAVEAVEAGE